MAEIRSFGAVNDDEINGEAINGPGILPPVYYDTFALGADLIIPAEPNTLVFPREVRELAMPGWQ